MRKLLSLFEMYCVRWNGVKRGLLFLVALNLILGSSRSAVAQCPPLAVAALPAVGAAPFPCRFDATLTRQFTPASAPKDTYRAYVTEAPLEQVLGAFKGVAQSESVQGAWTIEETDPLSAFGEAGLYDRGKVARLYGGKRARVARGPIVRNGRTIRSITLVSPYPAPSLTSLERGTLIIDYRISSSE
jgi:hypothetical protein